MSELHLNTNPDRHRNCQLNAEHPQSNLVHSHLQQESRGRSPVSSPLRKVIATALDAYQPRVLLLSRTTSPIAIESLPYRLPSARIFAASTTAAGDFSRRYVRIETTVRKALPVSRPASARSRTAGHPSRLEPVYSRDTTFSKTLDKILNVWGLGDPGCGVDCPVVGDGVSSTVGMSGDDCMMSCLYERFYIIQYSDSLHPLDSSQDAAFRSKRPTTAFEVSRTRYGGKTQT